MKVLVVDDSRTMRQLLSKLLTRQGYEAVLATNGREGVEALAGAEDIGLVLVDWRMPEMDGLEFIRLVRATRAPTDLPILMITTRVEEDEARTIRAAGANDLLLKPFEAHQLVECIGKLVSDQG